VVCNHGYGTECLLPNDSTCAFLLLLGSDGLPAARLAWPGSDSVFLLLWLLLVLSLLLWLLLLSLQQEKVSCYDWPCC
jgi:hypothetical protein